MHWVNHRWLFGLVLALAAVPATAQNPTFSIEVAALNGATIFPRVNSISIQPNDMLTAEIFVRDWSGVTSRPLRSYQAELLASSYTSGTAGNLFPKDFGTTTNVNGKCTASGSDGVENPTNAFLETSRADFVHFGLNPFTSVDTLSCGYRYGSAVPGSGALSDPGDKYYLGSVALQAAPNASGTFTIRLDPTNSNLWQSAGNPIPSIAYENMTVTVIPFTDLNILSSIPLRGTIDARMPTNLAGTNPQGFTAIDLTFNKGTMSLTSSDFTVTLDPSGPPPPMITSVFSVGNNLRLNLGTPIPPGRWTIFTHSDTTPTNSRLGFLPGDVTGNSMSDHLDVAHYINYLESELGLETWQSDIDRDGVNGLLDLQALLNIMNGAQELLPWLNQSLPPF